MCSHEVFFDVSYLQLFQKRLLLHHFPYNPKEKANQLLLNKNVLGSMTGKELTKYTC